MRKFIVSDLHGDGNVYRSIMSYLDNISKNEEIELYINGDLIDRGIESADMLLDIKKRIEENKYPIIYLAGNHELMMYEMFEKRRKNLYIPPINDWYRNGGGVTDYGLSSLLNKDKDKIFEVVDFISNLKIYHKFPETIDYKNIVLVHAACPVIVKDDCDITLKDNNDVTYYAVWTRELDPYIPFRCRVGHSEYFTIVGHTPNDNKYGVEYHLSQDYLNIDGASSMYVCGYFNYDHIPLVEVCDNYLKILTFNNNNEIIYGNYFTDYKLVPMNEDELNKERGNLDNSFKPKKLIKLLDGKIDYEK